MTPDGRFLLTVEDEKEMVRLWEVATGRCLTTFNSHCDFDPDVPYSQGMQDDRRDRKSRWMSASISPDGRYALMSLVDDSLRLWEIASGQEIMTFEGHYEQVPAVCFSPDGRYALSGSWDMTVRLWDVDGVHSGRCLRTLHGHNGNVEAVCFSPDGRHGLSSSQDGSMRLWNLQTGECVRVIKGDAGGVVCITSDGRYALTSGATVRLWRLLDGQCLKTLEGYTKGCDGVRSVSLSFDDRYAISGGYDNTARLWEFDWEYEIPEPRDWDEGARPFLEVFLTLHAPKGPAGGSLFERPVWDDHDFRGLLLELGHRGYGWLRPEGVRRQLEKLTEEWKGPPELQPGERW
jgi:WD40 repeat protein